VIIPKKTQVAGERRWGAKNNGGINKYQDLILHLKKVN